MIYAKFIQNNRFLLNFPNRILLPNNLALNFNRFYCLSTLSFVYNYIRSFLLCQVYQEEFFYNKNMTVGEKIKELRLEKGLTQLNLSKLIGVSQKAIDYWERNVSEPKSSYIIFVW